MKLININIIILAFILLSINIQSISISIPNDIGIDDDCLTVKKKHPEMKINCGFDYSKDSAKDAQQKIHDGHLLNIPNHL
jgi:hypothetical protein